MATTRLSWDQPNKKVLLVRRVFIVLVVLGPVIFFSYSRLTRTSQSSQSQVITDISADQFSPITTTLDSYSQISTQTQPLIYAKSYILIDSVTNERLLEKSADLPVPIASTTKMVTALVAINSYPLDRVITVPAKAAGINGSKIGLQTGQTITVEDLLKGLLIQSGNDAAFALALADNPEDYQPFVDKMNKFVIDHHLTGTVLADPAGLDDDNGHSTAFDLSQLARLTLANKALAQIVTTAQTIITVNDRSIQFTLKSSNRLLLADSSYFLPGVLGIKTGFTPAAGHCLVSGLSINNRPYIGVILDTNESSIDASAKEMKKLFNWAQSAVTVVHYM